MEIATIEFGTGRAADVFSPDNPKQGALLWHGSDVANRYSMRRLAFELARADVAVVVPDFFPTNDNTQLDKELTASIEMADEQFQNRSIAIKDRTIVGWSYGARAAVGVALNPARDEFSRAVGLAGNYCKPDPISSTKFKDFPPSKSAEVLLVHAWDDSQVCHCKSEELIKTLRTKKTCSHLLSIDGGHATPVLADYSGELKLTIPAVELTKDMETARDLIVSFCQGGHLSELVEGMPRP